MSTAAAFSEDVNPIEREVNNSLLASYPQTAVEDMVNHPSHYTAYRGIEIIELTEQMNFNRGNAVKYIARAGLKGQATEVQDLEKARWYIDREIQRMRGARD